MKITECKRYKIIPAPGTPVQTVMSQSIVLPYGKAMDYYIKLRRNGYGVFNSMVEGSTGEFWWIDHEDKSIGIYHVDEIFDR
jgi:hypothetical protein